MHIILLILRIIGIIFLVLLGLVLALLLIVLFVPVRYQLKADLAPKNSFRAEFAVTWLLHLIRVKGAFNGKEFGMSVKLAWLTIMKSGSDEPESSKKADTVSAQEKLSKKPDTAFAKKELSEKTDIVSEEKKPETVPAMKTDTLPDETVSSQTMQEQQSAHIAEEKTPADTDTAKKQLSADDSDVKAELPADSQKTEKRFDPAVLKRKLISLKKPKKVSEDKNKVKEDSASKSRELKKARFIQILSERISYVFRLICSLPQIVSAFLAEAVLLCSGMPLPEGGIGEKIGDRIKKLQKTVKPYMQDRMKKLYARLLKKLFRLLGHYKPRKMEGYIHFGTGSPDLTGKLTGMMYLILPANACRYEIRPEFTEALIDTDTAIKGHIRCCHVAALLISCLLDKDFRRMLRLIRRRREG